MALIFLSLGCGVNDARLVNSVTNYTTNGGSTITGILEICTEGDYAAVCDTISERTVALACQRIGYSSECSAL